MAEVPLTRFGYGKFLPYLDRDRDLPDNLGLSSQVSQATNTDAVAQQAQMMALQKRMQDEQYRQNIMRNVRGAPAAMDARGAANIRDRMQYLNALKGVGQGSTPQDMRGAGIPIDTDMGRAQLEGQNIANQAAQQALDTSFGETPADLQLKQAKELLPGELQRRQTQEQAKIAQGQETFKQKGKEKIEGIKQKGAINRLLAGQYFKTKTTGDAEKNKQATTIENDTRKIVAAAIKGTGSFGYAGKKGITPDRQKLINYILERGARPGEQRLGMAKRINDHIRRILAFDKTEIPGKIQEWGLNK